MTIYARAHARPTCCEPKVALNATSWACSARIDGDVANRYRSFLSIPFLLAEDVTVSAKGTLGAKVATRTNISVAAWLMVSAIPGLYSGYTAPWASTRSLNSAIPALQLGSCQTCSHCQTRDHESAAQLSHQLLDDARVLVKSVQV